MSNHETKQNTDTKKEGWLDTCLDCQTAVYMGKNFKSVSSFGMTRYKHKICPKEAKMTM